VEVPNGQAMQSPVPLPVLYQPYAHLVPPPCMMVTAAAAAPASSFFFMLMEISLLFNAVNSFFISLLLLLG
jgi:hypothetical protein